MTYTLLSRVTIRLSSVLWGVLQLTAFLGLALLASGCAPKATQPADSPQEPKTVVWRLTPEAQETYYYLLLQDAKRDNNSGAVAYALENLLKLNPSPNTYIEAANHYWRQGETAAARQLLKKSLETYPGNQELTLLLAETYLAEKRLDDAVVTLRTFLNEHPDAHHMRRQLAEVLLDAKQFAEALDALNAIPADARGRIDRYYKGKALAGLNRTEEAIAAYQELVDEDPDFLEAWAELAYLYESRKDYAAAEETYSRLLELGESSQELLLRLIDLNLKLNTPQTAMSLYKQGPESASFALGTASLLLENGFYDQAETVLSSMADENQTLPETLFYAALLAYEGRNDLEKALQFLEQVPEDHRTYPRSVRFRAHLLYDLGRQEEALDLLREGREQFPGDKEFWALGARLLQDDGQYEKAALLLEKAMEKWPNDTELIYLSGMTYEYQGMTDLAVEQMEKVISLNPDNPEALNYLGYVLADQNKDLDRALVLISRALEQKPQSAYIIDSMAWVMYRQGRLDEAWEYIRNATSKETGDPIIWEHYGDIARALGKIDEARSAYRKALELTPKNPQEIRSKLEAL